MVAAKLKTSTCEVLTQTSKEKGLEYIVHDEVKSDNSRRYRVYVTEPSLHESELQLAELILKMCKVGYTLGLLTKTGD